MRFPVSKQKKLTRFQLRTAAASTFVVAAMFGIVCILGVWITGKSMRGERNRTATPEITQTSTTGPRLESNAGKFPVVIRTPLGPPTVATGLFDNQGEPVTVACSICHANRKPDFSNRSVTDLQEFHGTLKFSHGTVSCLSCHNPDDYNQLKLADGSPIEFTDVMTLCGQCHGPQMKDYQHNVHGGMNGYWDLTRGPRTKNNCVDCHNPHSPQFPKMQPTFKPRDRFLDKGRH